MNIFYKAVVVCLSLLALSGCDEKKRQSKTLTMITAADNPPFEFYNTAATNREIIGYDVDLAKKIAQYLGYELEIQDVDFSGVIPAVLHGRADFGMASLSPTDERKKSVDFSNPYYSAKNVIVTKSDSDFASLTTYDKNKVGVQMGSTQEQFAKVWVQSRPGVSIRTLSKIGNIIQEVLAGRMDGAILEETPAQAYIKAHGTDLSIFPIQGGPEEAYAITFAKGSDKVEKFNEALRALKENGFLDELAKKWLKK